MGVALGYAVLAYHSLGIGLAKLELNEEALAADLDGAWEVLAEPIQTVMRRYGVQGAYEKLKEVTRGKTVPRGRPARADPLAGDPAGREGTAAGDDAGQLHRQGRRARRELTA